MSQGFFILKKTRGFSTKNTMLENRKPERLPLTLDEALQW
jgi:hypothetical protein